MFLRTLLRKLFAARESKDVEMVKPFLDHLEDLRWTLVKMAAVLSVGMVLSFAFRAQLIRIVEAPLLAVGHGNVHLQALGPADSMNVSLTLAFYAGIVLTFPLQLYFLAGFVLPALSQKEKAYVLPIIGATFALFLGGVFFCFLYILPLTLRWLFYDAQHMGFDPGWTVTTYFSFATQFVLIFGISFELPVAVILLVKIGILSAATLRRTRAYAAVVILALGTIIAPSPDPITMMVVAGPMLLLYEGSIWIAWWIERDERSRLARPAPRLPDDKA